MSAVAQLMAGMERTAPGSDAATVRVLAVLEDLPSDAKILDVGAGTGAQSIVLATALPQARITALDISEGQLAVLQRRAQEAGVAGRIATHTGPMHAMDFPAASFDAIWSEGAAYIMGLNNALRKWKPMLKPRGFLVISECTWLTVAPSPDAQDFWDEAYPAMQTLEQNLELARDAGYEVLGTYVLPLEAWQHNYYEQLEPRVASALAQYEPSSREWKAVERVRREIEIFRAHGNQYGYVFYALRAK
ncbi:MAG TPA: class I SAM-dependent methyltransferase [Candidatus Baltobacteraceae bacterium]|nr:class I SAM-dependent methyltransferase [Candidatus Baltobacteraceae bacterium]